MGFYATTSSLDVLMIGTTFDTATTALGTKLITQAETEVRKMLSKRYSLNTGTVLELAATTTAATPPIVTTWTEWFSMGLMYVNMARGSEEARERGMFWIAQTKEDITKVLNFEVDVVGADGNILGDKSETQIKVLDANDGFKQTFDEDDPLQWRVDSDKLDKIAGERD